MNAYKQLLRELIRALLPKQNSKGSGVVQAGRIDGNVTVINNHHKHLAPRAPVAFSAEHGAVLDLMKQLENRVAVLEFMQREFGTKMVKELQPAELFRLRRYVEVVIEKTSTGRA